MGTSDFEKLRIARLYVTQLLKEIADLKYKLGIVQSEYDELQYKKDKVVNKLRNDLATAKKITLTDEERIQAHKDHVIVSLKSSLKPYAKINNELREENKKLKDRLKRISEDLIYWKNK